MKRPEVTAFDRFVAIDWSGGRGCRHKGIAVAVAVAGRTAPYLVPPPPGGWSRRSVGDWLLDQSGRVLAGFDFSFALPFADRDGYLPGLSGDARGLWAEIEQICDGDADFYGGRFVDRHAAHFLTARGRGAMFMPRLRVTEAACRAQGLGRAESAFHLVGPSQVGLASLAGMRLLRWLSERGQWALWPFAPPGDRTVVELYTRLFLIQAGMGTAKIRDRAGLERALRALGSDGAHYDATLSDHETDVLVAAAGMRRLAERGGAAHGGALWHPPALSDKVRRTEGWTWGVS